MEMSELLKEIESIKYEIWDIDKLIPYARNPRKNDHVVDKMAGKIKEFGMPVPICIRPDGSIVDGHLRYKACKKLGLPRVPVAINDTWTPVKIKAYRLSVNQAAEMAEWDTEFQALELQELKDQGYDLDQIGFSGAELNNLLSGINFHPGIIEEQGKLDKKSPIVCPACNHEFIA